MFSHQYELDERQIAVDPAFRRDVLNGLAMRPRSIPARWLYDSTGSKLFEAITELPEYYVTRTERALLSSAVHEIVELAGPERTLVEFGSGSSTKTRILLSVMKPAAYVPIDISRDFLRKAAARLSEELGELPIYPVEGDFTETLRLPPAVGPLGHLGFFPGSTIGNLLSAAAVDLLRTMARTLGQGSMLLIGIDRMKDPQLLLPAYNDAQGVTAAFNLNLLHRINRELRGTLPVGEFRHAVLWKEAEARIEMHLEAQHDVRFLVDGRAFSIAAGDTIHTENSLKYCLPDAFALLRAGGWTPIADWTDPQEFFSLILATEGVPASAKAP